MSTVDQRTEPVPAPAPPRRPNRGLALLRNSWRQLTSMRTALVLLFLLAVAAIPGSLLPQRNVNPERVNTYLAEHPHLGPALDRLGAFAVFSSPWFSAIYLLLFVSLVGCILPRARDHIRALRSLPPRAPQRLQRLPQHRAGLVDPRSPDEAARWAAAMLRKRRWRTVVREEPDGVMTVAAEKGYLKETGNLFFHVALVAVLVGVAIGSWFGWHANRLLVQGPDTAFCNTLQQYSGYTLGARVDPGQLPRFCLELTDFTATYHDTGEPASFAARARLDRDGTSRMVTFSVNDPLRLGDANVYLLGHGYAPVIRYTDRYGRSQTVVSPFLPSDQMLTSQGVAAFPDANVDPATGDRSVKRQVAFEGLFMPTRPDSPPFDRSAFPALKRPAVMLFAYRGDLGLDAGIPGSVYSLDQHQIDTGRLKQVGQPKLLGLGQSWRLDDGTTVQFVGVRQWVSLSIRHDPGELIVLGSVAALLVGLMLSLTGRRRRVWFRLTPTPQHAGSAGKVPAPGSSLIEAGGLPRTDYPGFADEFAQVVADVGGHGRGVGRTDT